MKICSVCNKEKLLSEYYSQNKKKADGTPYIYYNPKCKECTIKATRESQEKHIDHLVEYRKNRYSDKKDYYIEKANTRNRENKDENREYLRKWQQSNKDKVKGYNENRAMHKKHKIFKKEWEACKEYFDYKCAYCDLPIEEHFKMWKGELKQTDFHKEHVDHEGANDLSNCVPACQSCNSSKHTSSLEEWYSEDNEIYSIENLERILKWLNEDYIQYIILK
ncbi:HNH endonuclease [Ureibacillus chungkukjangi]|uniref:HNH endonuclease signature motif containing protein n=1 Tax=Ureibacillus chungkukjangi TaxID=1202712 RepID=UPI002041D8AC|nr:HNH endonuclease signature motif containing protein [Ureibacillus chungkukjangi]MCM3387288.1 HNH endonuclease [Ureibacillus chungkukjangi]